MNIHGPTLPPQVRVALAVVGDSDSHSYQDRNHFPAGSNERGGEYRATTLCWNEVLARLRGDWIDPGEWGLHGSHWLLARVLGWLGRPARSPFKEDYRYNFAMSGNGCRELLGGHHRQVARLLAVMDSEPRRWLGGVVVLRIGINDFGRDVDLDDLARHGAASRVHATIARCVRQVHAAVAAIHRRHPHAGIVLVGISDNSNWARYLDRWCAPGMLANIHAGLDAYDHALRAMADADHRIAFFDDRAWFATRWGGRDATGQPAYRALRLADDLVIDNSLGDAPTSASVKDGHAGTAWNAEWARSLLDLVNARFGLGIPAITRAEVAALARAGLRPPAPVEGAVDAAAPAALGAHA